MTTRRDFLASTALGAAGLALGQTLPTVASAQPPAAGDTARDKFWIFTVYAGGDNEGWGLPKPSRMTPVEGAFYLNVPNLLLIRSHEIPAIADFAQWAIPMRPLKRVLWSLVGSGGKTAGEEREATLKLAAEFPNIVGFIMDDFFHKDGTGTLAPDELEALRKRLVIGGWKRDLYVVLYTHQLHLPVKPSLAHCDKITLWTWWSEKVADLEENFKKLEALAPDHGKLLGCYMWDYGNKKPMPVERMKHQCELGLRWLKEKRLEGMIFLANTSGDLGLDSVEWTRRWIAEVGEQKV